MKKRVKEDTYANIKDLAVASKSSGRIFTGLLLIRRHRRMFFTNVYTMKYFDRLVPLGSGSGPQRQIERHTRSLAGLTNGVIHFLNAKTYGKSEMDVR